jgi:hypothetical protein
MTVILRRLLPAVGAMLLPWSAGAQQVSTVIGRVMSEGTPVPSATVSIPELGLGALTNEAGRYTISVPGARVQGQTVTVTARRVGYRPQNVRVTISEGSVTQDFELAANPLQLGEVVITGAGTATEVEKLGNVRNAVSAEQIVKANEPNVVQALAAKAPNVVINQSAGDPGAGSSIRIRGIRTLNGSVEPLFIVDGVPVDNSSISTTNFNVIDVILGCVSLEF